MVARRLGGWEFPGLVCAFIHFASIAPHLQGTAWGVVEVCPMRGLERKRNLELEREAVLAGRTRRGQGSVEDGHLCVPVKGLWV